MFHHYLTPAQWTARFGPSAAAQNAVVSWAKGAGLTVTHLYPNRLVVDLSKVSYIDSSGLAVLIEAMQNVEAYGGRFFLAGLQENVRPIFEIARLDQVFIIFPHVDAALVAT